MGKAGVDWSGYLEGGSLSVGGGGGGEDSIQACPDKGSRWPLFLVVQAEGRGPGPGRRLLGPVSSLALPSRPLREQGSWGQCPGLPRGGGLYTLFLEALRLLVPVIQAQLPESPSWCLPRTSLIHGELL